jgi:sigma-B regulation protein RsbU (phosphoserine phosphatase)
MSARSLRARILVVDDDPGVLRAVRRVLGTQYELATASSPAEALSAAAALDPDLAILDIRMPGMDGFELMQRLKSAQPDLDVIFITGSMTEPDAHIIRAIRQGAFYFIQKPFDREVLQTLVERCLELRQLRAVASRELTKLHMAQARLLPQAVPVHPEYRLAFRYRPFYFATGDYHDFFPQPDGSLDVFVGDSTGHGPSACMLMATMRTLLYTHPQIHGDPAGALCALTRMFHALIPPDLFMTAVYLVFARDGWVRWSVAGQQPPLRLTIAGEVAAIDGASSGLPLGVVPDARYETVTYQMQPGERLIVFTDGIVEATNRKGKLFGLTRVQSSLTKLARESASTEAILDGLLDSVREYMDGSDFEDDLTLMAVERREGQR